VPNSRRAPSSKPIRMPVLLMYAHADIGAVEAIDAAFVSVALSALVPLRLAHSTSLTETLLEVGHSGPP
jgi:hypothetical protein